MEYEERTLELNVISAVDLKKVKTLGEQKCSVVAYVYRKQQKKSKADKRGGNNPIWNHTIFLTCEERLLHSPQDPANCLTVEIRCDGFFRNKLVGTVTVPLHGIAKEEGQIMSHQVFRPSGKAKGRLNMGIKLGEVRTVQRYAAYQAQAYPPAAAAAPPGYGAPPYAHGTMQPPQYYPQMQQPAMYGGQQQAAYGFGAYPHARPARPRRGGGMGFGTGLAGGALGGLLVGNMLDDWGDNDCGDMGDFGGD